MLEDFASPDFRDEANLLAPATVYENQVWGDLYERPVPLLRLYPPAILDSVPFTDGAYTCDLPYAMAFSPIVEIDAQGGETMDFFTDRYCVNGGPGGTKRHYNSHMFRYVCQPGHNAFTFPGYIFGEQMIVRCYASDAKTPAALPVRLGYRESGYDTDIVGSFRCDCSILNTVVEKAGRTLYVCMRDNFMDCPDRERGQWIGDVSAQAPQVMFLLDEKGKLLLKKAIYDFICLRQGDVLVGNVPGIHASEFPGQSMNAVSHVGIIAQYYQYTADRSILELCFEPVVRYLMLWEMEDNGLVRQRPSNGWFDHLFNVDKPVLENAWYYSGLRFARMMADTLDDHRFDAFIDPRMASMLENFDKVFWQKGRKQFRYSSGSVEDDRAHAMAVIAGLCPRSHYEDVREILLSVFNSTVYLEYYVEMALCEMGFIHDAYRRMASRYYSQMHTGNSTLWEDFFLLGTRNHAWAGGPASIAFQYFMGIRTEDGFRTFTVDPCKDLFRCMEASFQLHDGRIATVRVEDGKTDISIAKV